MYDWQFGMEGRVQMFSVFTTEHIYSLKKSVFSILAEAIYYEYLNGIHGIY